MIALCKMIQNCWNNIKNLDNDDDLFDDFDAILERKQQNKTSRDSSVDRKPPASAQQQMFSTMPAKKTGVNFEDDDLGVFGKLKSSKVSF